MHLRQCAPQIAQPTCLLHRSLRLRSPMCTSVMTRPCLLQARFMRPLQAEVLRRMLMQSCLMADPLNKGCLPASWWSCAEIEESRGRALQKGSQLASLLRPIDVGLVLLHDRVVSRGVRCIIIIVLSCSLNAMGQVRCSSTSSVALQAALF